MKRRATKPRIVGLSMIASLEAIIIALRELFHRLYLRTIFIACGWRIYLAFSRHIVLNDLLNSTAYDLCISLKLKPGARSKG